MRFPDIANSSIPDVGSEAAFLFHVYRRVSLSSIFRTSIGVLLDKPTWDEYKIPGSLLSYRAFAENRGLCGHEKALINHLEETEAAPPKSEYNSLADTAPGYTAGNFEPASNMVMEEAPSDNNEDGPICEKDPTERYAIGYCSRMPRFFFACPEDEKALTRILDGIRIASSKIDGKGSRFLCTDVQVLCPQCDKVLK